MGQTAVIIPVREAERAVHRWRDRFDPAAAAGVPEYVTVIFPFLVQAHLDVTVLDDLRCLVADEAAFHVRFARCGQFPEALYLAPAPEEPFRRLTTALTRRWPEAPPYGGVISDPTPHLTITYGATSKQVAEAERDLKGQLPISATVAEAWLISSTGAGGHDGRLSSWARRTVPALVPRATAGLTRRGGDTVLRIDPRHHQPCRTPARRFGAGKARADRGDQRRFIASTCASRRPGCWQ